jgi:methyl-accepting chemotaxis protein
MWLQATVRDPDRRLPDHKSKSNIERLFATVDRSGLTTTEEATLESTQRHFEKLFGEDDKIIALLRSQGTAAFPQIMHSINGGPAGDAWRAVYDDMTRLAKSIDARSQRVHAEREAVTAHGRLMVYVGLGLAVLAAVAVVSLVTRSITVPLRRTVTVLESVAAGHLDERLDIDTGDEVGRLAQALNTAVTNLGDAMRELDGTAEALASASEGLSTVSVGMTSSASESSAQAGVVSSAADQVSQHVQTVAAGTEQMSASILEIAQQATARRASPPGR